MFNINSVYTISFYLENKSTAKPFELNQFTKPFLVRFFYCSSPFVLCIHFSSQYELFVTLIADAVFLCFAFISEYLMTGSPRTAGYPARSPINQDAPNHHRYVFIFMNRQMIARFLYSFLTIVIEQYEMLSGFSTECFLNVQC